MALTTYVIFGPLLFKFDISITQLALDRFQLTFEAISLGYPALEPETNKWRLFIHHNIVINLHRMLRLCKRVVTK